MYCEIYKIKNTVNGKLYIGQTWRSLKKRWYEHLTQFGCVKLVNAISKYGKEKFSIELITLCHTQETADYWESFFIEKFDTINNGYNLKSGGSKGKMSQESKLKMSSSHIGKKLSNEAKDKKSKFMMGNAHALGKKFSDFTKNKMSASKKLSQKGEGNNASKLNWNIVNEIRSSVEGAKIVAARYGISRRTISDIRSYKTWKN